VLNKEIPLLRICIPLCSGIILARLTDPGKYFFTSAVIISIISLLASLRFNGYRNNIPFGLALLCSLILAGALMYEYEKKSLTRIRQEPAVFTGILSDYPEDKPASYMLNIKLYSGISENGKEKIKGSMVVYLRKDDSSRVFLPGDIISLKCIPREIVNKGNPYEFDYRFYMENLGVKYYSYINGSDIISHIAPGRRSPRHSALILRQYIIRMYGNRGITEKRLPLVSAITLGERDKLDQEQKQNFIKAGVMHIMAVSGLHAIILCMFISNILFFLKGRLQVLKIVIVILFLWTFAFVTGLTPSVMRAALMFTFIEAGKLMNRRVNSINSVLASALVLIVVRPSVIFDAGFLLSYSAVIYIILFYNEFYLKLNPSGRVIKWLCQSIAVTIVAQAGTLPLTLLLFNRFPVYFLLTNIIIVPLSSLAVIIGFLIPLLYPVRFISLLLGIALDRLTLLTELLTEKAASLPGSNIEGIGMIPVECVLMFLAFFAIMNFILKRKSTPMYIPLIFTLIYISAGFFKYVSVKTTSEIIVYNSAVAEQIGIRNGPNLTVYSDTIYAGPEVKKHCASMGLNLFIKKIEKNPYYLKAGQSSILISSDPWKLAKTNPSPEILIITGRMRKDKLHINADEIVTLSSGFYKPDNDSVSFHSVKSSGAYRKTL
jgi:competence protein ComEC